MCPRNIPALGPHTLYRLDTRYGEAMTHEQLKAEIQHLCLLQGEFKLRSGQTSTHYFDKYRFEAQPRLLTEVAKQMQDLIPTDTEALAGLELGGVPVATALSLETGLPTVFVRKKPKEYGTCQFAEGLEISGKRLCVIEDVITTGGQVVESCQDLRAVGAQIDHVLCVINRGGHPNTKLNHENLSLKELFDFSNQ